MPNPAPATRLPFDQGERPLYRPPPRLGCSGVALVSILTLVAFALMFVVFTPRVIEGLRGVSLPQVLGLARPTPTVSAAPTPATDTTPVAEVDPTPGPDLAPTAEAGPAAATPEPTGVPPTSTPEPEYVAIGNSSGDNVSLRAEPKADSKKLIALPPRSILRLLGADVTTDGKQWRNVRTTGDSEITGWIMAQYLVPSGPP